ncbi:MAG: hypothetical protein GXP26_08780 [Planctomycetes bacterium]|nr:hypothetical protein [Planctomycetota bacterium]
MLLDFEVRSCSRRCVTTEQALQPGDVYFSVLEEQETGLQRLDYCVEAWQGPPEICVGWWRSRVPGKDGGKPKLAPTEVMLNLFAALAKRPEDQEFRYLLSLLLLRRRILRREEVKQNEEGIEVHILFCPRRDEQFEVVAAEPDAEQATLVQQRMIDLLYGDGEAPTSTNAKVASN